MQSLSTLLQYTNKIGTTKKRNVMWSFNTTGSETSKTDACRARVDKEVQACFGVVLQEAMEPAFLDNIINQILDYSSETQVLLSTTVEPFMHYLVFSLISLICRRAAFVHYKTATRRAVL